MCEVRRVASIHTGVSRLGRRLFLPVCCADQIKAMTIRYYRYIDRRDCGPHESGRLANTKRTTKLTKNKQLQYLRKSHDRHDTARGNCHHANQYNINRRDLIGTVADPPLREGIISNRSVLLLLWTLDQYMSVGKRYGLTRRKRSTPLATSWTSRGSVMGSLLRLRS